MFENGLLEGDLLGPKCTRGEYGCAERLQHIV
jgi:hypothetical protein